MWKLFQNNRYGMGFRGYNPEMPSFSDESQSLKKLNENLANSPLPGRLKKLQKYVLICYLL